MKKMILIVGLIAAIGGIAFGTYEYYRPTASTSDIKADVTISAAELFTAFENDETAANTAYTDKVVEVKGIVIDVKQNEEAPTVILETTSAMGGILCTMYPSENSKLASLKQGDAVTIKGKCTGFLMDVVLKECVIN